MRGERPQPKPREGILLAFGEFVGTFIANFISLAVIQAGVDLTTNAETKSFMSELNPLVQVPPALSQNLAGHPVVAPQSLFGNYTGDSHIQPARPIHFPRSGLMISLGIALGFGIALQVTKHMQLNPTFTVAMALFGERQWKHVGPCILAQMCGGLVACYTLSSCKLGLNLCQIDAAGAFVCGQLPQTFESAAMWGVTFPGTDPFTWRPGGLSVPDKMELPIGSLIWSNVIFTAFMVIAVLPIFSKDKDNQVSDIAAPWFIAVIILPFVMAQGTFGVSNNAAMFFAGLIYCSLAGWPSQIWSHANYYSVVVACSPFVGAGLGTGILMLLRYLNSKEGPLHTKPDWSSGPDVENPVSNPRQLLRQDQPSSQGHLEVREVH